MTGEGPGLRRWGAREAHRGHEEANRGGQGRGEGVVMQKIRGEKEEGWGERGRKGADEQKKGLGCGNQEE